MRWIIGIALLLLGFSLKGGEIKVTTWNLKWFPSGGQTALAPEKEAERISQAAEVLKKLNPDIILLEEVRDFATCYKLANAIGGHQVVICSRFTEFGGIVGWQQVAILSKQEAVAAWSEDWKTFGTVDLPRGFAFAQFKFGTNDVAVYSLHLKSNLIRGDDDRGEQLNILKRELAAEQLIQHIADIEALQKKGFECIVIGGDFNTSKDQFFSESTIATLEKAGFSSGFENLPLRERVTHPGSGKYPDATFDYVYARERSPFPPVIASSVVSDHYPVTRKLVLP